MLTQGTAIPLTIDDGSVASTMSMARTTASAVNEAMASTKASGYTDTILASKYWANQSKLCSLVWQHTRLNHFNCWKTLRTY